ncbi:hypothetical protein ILUMI_19177, partial [Ignelater luminosus]
MRINGSVIASGNLHSDPLIEPYKSGRNRGEKGKRNNDNAVKGCGFRRDADRKDGFKYRCGDRNHFNDMMIENLLKKVVEIMQRRIELNPRSLVLSPRTKPVKPITVPNLSEKDISQEAISVS